jgi:ribonuclease HI
VDTLDKDNGVAWKMYFDGARSRICAGAGIAFTSPQSEVTSSYRLEFDCINNIVEYEAFLLGLALVREMGVKVLKVIGYFELVVLHVRYQFATKNERLKKYRHVVWDTIELFDAFSIIVVSRDENAQADVLAVAATILQLYEEMIQCIHKMEVIL